MNSNSQKNYKDANDNSTIYMYYGVYAPKENTEGDNNSPNVFEDKAEALKIAKKNKKSRFKAFRYYYEAVEFALNGSEFPNNDMTDNEQVLRQSSTAPTQASGEKASPFRCPKPQELVELRKAIEAGNYQWVQDIIWQNPRYLVNSGDTPSILQEGTRYNALHVAAKARNAAITELILSTISNVEFIKLLYGEENQQHAEDRTVVLLDLYLNTPNKGLNETPLHFASKYGAADVVEILVSYPQCDKTLKNKFHMTADQVICERAEGLNLAPVRKKIELLLHDNYYIPVLRAEDKSMPPVIGEPFSPTAPPVLTSDILSPRLEIHAYAGPLDKKGAHAFRKIWKTPPRSCSSPSLNNEKTKDLINDSSLRFKDLDKGLERIGRKLANKFDVNWKEYWPFLDNFVDISSAEGLNLLEDYLFNRYDNINKLICEEFDAQPTEFNRSTPNSSISDLCAAFSECHLGDSMSRSNTFDGDRKSDKDSIIYIDKACQVFANRISNDILYILCSEDHISQVLETEIKQLELLITSYMDDVRFCFINFQKVHSRLGLLIGQKLYNNIKEDVKVILCNKIESTLENITKSVDCCSDDEAHNFKDYSENRKSTSYKKQLICLIHYILNVLPQNYKNIQFDNEDECVRGWEDAEECTCTYHIKKPKRNSLSRNNSFKDGSKVFKNGAEKVSKSLNFNDNVINGLNHSINYSHVNSSSDVEVGGEDVDEDEEKFFTPPTSPKNLEMDSDSEGDFSDTVLPKYDVFIETDVPTKVDCEVFNALSYSDVTLDSNKYPNIYKWHHTINLYPADERERWPSSVKTKLESSSVSFNSSFSMDSPKTSTPSKSWLRITGANSPRAKFQKKNLHL